MKPLNLNLHAHLIQDYLKFILIILLVCFTQSIKSQHKEITLEGENITFQQVFEQIETQCNYTIAYNHTKFNINKKLSVSIRNAKIQHVLDTVLNGSGWTYLLEDKHILIIKENKTSNKKITQHLRGKVYDKSTGLPLAYASVIMLDNPAKGTLSDEKGYFEFKDLPPRRYNIKASFVGYKPFTYYEIILTSAKESFIEIALTENSFGLDEIVIKSLSNKDQPINPMVLAGGRMFSTEETSRYAGGFDDPARLVTSFAGVSGGIGDNSVIIHGNAPHLLQWRLEGMEIANPNHFADLITMGGGIFSSLSSHVLGNSDFLTGAFPAEYNNALSGIFDMKLRNGNNQKFEHSVQASLIGVDIASEGPLNKKGKSSYLLNYRNATFAFIRKFIPDMEINNFGYQDLSFKLHIPTVKGSFSIWGLGLIDKNYETFEKYPEEWSNDIYEKLNIKGNQSMASGGTTHTHFFNDKTSLKTSLGIVYNNNNLIPDTLNVLNSPLLNLKNKSYHLSASTSLNSKINSRNTIRSGITWTSMFYNFFYNKLEPNTYKSIQSKINGHTGTLSAYSNSLFQINRLIKLKIGVNGQVFLLNRNWTIEPRMAIDYSLKNHSLAFAYGLHSRLEKLTTYFIELEGQFSNKNLDFIKTHQFIFSYKWKMPNSKLLKIEPYFHYLYNIPMVTGTSYSTINGLSFLINIPLSNDGIGINKGIDLTFEHYLSNNFYFLLTGSIFDFKYKGKDDKWFNTRYNHQFLFNALGGKEWIFGNKNQHILGSNIKLAFRGGERYTPVNEKESIESRRVITYEDRMYKNQFSPKFKIDLTLNYKLNQRITTHEFAFKILNLTGVKEYYRHRLDNAGQSIVEDEVKIMLPNLSYKVSF